MLYSSLTTTELERWVYASPNDGMALVELMKRGPKLLRHECEAVDDLEAQIAMTEDLYKTSTELLEADKIATEERLKAATMNFNRYQTAMRAILHVATTVEM